MSSLFWALPIKAPGKSYHEHKHWYIMRRREGRFLPALIEHTLNLSLSILEWGKEIANVV